MKIAWSHFAETQLDEIYDYYLKKAGEKTASSLVVSIIRHADYLCENPKAGQEEELLKDRKTEYRYIVYKNYKIIYSVDEQLQFIKIADVFDTRQNPVKIKREKGQRE
jgi:toxin ParE1/3/4